MALNPVYFQILSPQQANPLGYGALQGTEMANNIMAARSQALKNRQLQAQLPYVDQNAQADLQSKLLANSLQQNTLNYAPQMSAADLAAKQVQPRLMNAQANEANARIPLYGAQTNLTNQQAKYLPLEDLIKAQNANQSSNRFGQYYQLAKSLDAMPIAARATWIANNQDTYNQMLATLGNGNAQQSYLTPQVMQRFFPGMQTAPMQGNGQPQGMPNGQPQGMPNSQVQGMPQQPTFAAPTPAQTDQVRLANQMAANKALTTSATQRQMEGAIQVEGIMNDPGFQEQVRDTANYAGALGKGKAAVAALSQTNPKAYENYLALKTQTMPLLLNRIKTLDQLGATDKQREDLENLYNSALNSITTNPKQFVTQINKLAQTLDTISRSVQTSATPIFNTNRLKGHQPIDMPSYFNSPASTSTGGKAHAASSSKHNDPLGIR